MSLVSDNISKKSMVGRLPYIFSSHFRKSVYLFLPFLLIYSLYSIGIHGKCFIPCPKRQKYVNSENNNNPLDTKKSAWLRPKKVWTVELVESRDFFLVESRDFFCLIYNIDPKKCLHMLFISL